MKNILVTGGAGFIGSALVREAVLRGHNVMNFDSLTYAANLSNLKQIKDLSNYQFVKGDLRNKLEIEQALDSFSPNIVVHLAAESHVDRSITSPFDFIQTNIVGTYNLLESVLKYRKSSHNPSNFLFLHISTDEVFGSLGESGRFSEISPYSPRSPYSASKASGDHLVMAWNATFGVPVVIVNCSNNYGPNQFPEKLVPKTIVRAFQKLYIPIYGEGKNIRDWLFVNDHVDALLKLIEQPTISGRYCLGGDSETTNLELVLKICKIMDFARPNNAPHEDLIEFVSDRVGHDFRYSVDSSRIKSDLNWIPVTSLDLGLEKTVTWYLDNEKWWRPLLNRS